MIALGSTFAGVGATAFVGYWIYTLENEGVALTAAPGIASAAITLLGFGLILYSMRARTRSDSKPQRQTSGANSTNIQAGRDVNIDSHSSDG